VLCELTDESDTVDSDTVDSDTDDSDGVESDCDVIVLSLEEVLLIVLLDDELLMELVGEE
jgi:hypothetical protein